MENNFKNVESVTVMLKDRTLISQTFIDENGELTTIANKDYITEIVIKDPSIDESFII